jgi:hypothetical protein
VASCRADPCFQGGECDKDKGERCIHEWTNGMVEARCVVSDKPVCSLEEGQASATEACKKLIAGDSGQWCSCFYSFDRVRAEKLQCVPKSGGVETIFEMWVFAHTSGKCDHFSFYEEQNAVMKQKMTELMYKKMIGETDVSADFETFAAIFSKEWEYWFKPVSGPTDWQERWDQMWQPNWDRLWQEVKDKAQPPPQPPAAKVCVLTCSTDTDCDRHGCSTNGFRWGCNHDGMCYYDERSTTCTVGAPHCHSDEKTGELFRRTLCLAPVSGTSRRLLNRFSDQRR